jgi:hypothetical protein
VPVAEASASGLVNEARERYEKGRKGRRFYY